MSTRPAAPMGARTAVEGQGAPAPDAGLHKLFSPFPWGNGSLRNRIAMAPMTRNASPGGIAGLDVARYYARRAAGGAGLIITEGTCIDHPSANGYRNVPAMYGAGLVGWRRTVNAVHAEGARIVAQLWHVGAVRRPGMEPDANAPGVGPEAELDADGRTLVKRLAAGEIAEIARSYARAALAAEELGFDGVEIHGAHGYLIDQFLWHQSNQRDDAYGGSISNRTRFAAEVVQAVRRAVSRQFPIVFRFSQWKMSDYRARIATTPDELRQVLMPLVDAGVDVFHASTRRFWEPAFDGSDHSLAQWTRKLGGKPVIAVGSIGLSQQHETRSLRTRDNVDSPIADLAPMLASLEHGCFDLIAVGRGMLADPDWACKVRDGRAIELGPLTAAALAHLH